MAMGPNDGSDIHPETNDFVGKLYERYVALLLRESGYEVQLTAASHDEGADILAYLPGQRVRPAYVVQCKALQRPAGLDAVQEVATARLAFQGERALLVSLNGVTESAQQLAQKVAVECVAVGLETWAGDMEPWPLARHYLPPEGRHEGLRILEQLPELIERRAWVALECPGPLEQWDWGLWTERLRAVYDGPVAGWPLTAAEEEIATLVRQVHEAPHPGLFLLGPGLVEAGLDRAAPLIDLKTDSTATFAFLWVVPLGHALPGWVQSRLDARIPVGALPGSWYRPAIPSRSELPVSPSLPDWPPPWLTLPVVFWGGLAMVIIVIAILIR